jgi:hypothetical protein
MQRDAPAASDGPDELGGEALVEPTDATRGVADPPQPAARNARAPMTAEPTVIRFCYMSRTEADAGKSRVNGV